MLLSTFLYISLEFYILNEKLTYKALHDADDH